MQYFTIQATTGNQHLRRQGVRSTTICGRDISKRWKDAEFDGRRMCGMCDDIAARATDYDHERDDDQFAAAYGLGGDA